MLRFLHGVGCEVSLSPLLLGKGLPGGSLELPAPISKAVPPPAASPQAAQPHSAKSNAVIPWGTVVVPT